MAQYSKGANAERELVHTLFDAGFSVVRVAGSGKTSLPAPDIIALRKGRVIAFECKAWNAKNLAIPIEQMQEFRQWCNRAGAEAVIGWKVPHKGWFFLKPEQLHNSGKYFLISLKDAMQRGKSLQELIG
jgi:Holliday junction resolvase